MFCMRAAHLPSAVGAYRPPQPCGRPGRRLWGGSRLGVACNRRSSLSGRERRAPVSARSAPAPARARPCAFAAARVSRGRLRARDGARTSTASSGSFFETGARRRRGSGSGRPFSQLHSNTFSIMSTTCFEQIAIMLEIIHDCGPAPLLGRAWRRAGATAGGAVAFGSGGPPVWLLFALRVRNARRLDGVRRRHAATWGRKMRRFTIALAACTLSGSLSAAEDCTVEDWRWYAPIPNTVTIEGATTCEAGRIIVRLYDGEGESRVFLAVDRGFIEGYAFQASFMEVAKPKAPTIRYIIKPE